MDIQDIMGHHTIYQPFSISSNGLKQMHTGARSRVSKAEDAWLQIQEQMERELQAGARVCSPRSRTRSNRRNRHSAPATPWW